METEPRVALHQRFAVITGKFPNWQAVDENKVGEGIKLEIGQTHRFMRRL